MFNSDYFHSAVPQRPQAKYAHIVVLRETDSYALFQTDGELNTARVSTGRTLNTAMITRITMFKRKQTTPERLIGRELLRGYGFISGEQADGKRTEDSQKRLICDYNVRFCMQCPDCISYGFAIGDSGSEKSKIYSDTAYSLTAYDISHEAFTLNAPYESGTMSRQGVPTSRINEQDHIRPQTLFPAVITFRDPTEAMFNYVLNNVLRTRRYGAQTTRTGTVTNHPVAIIFSDGEVFSNLALTQALYDELAANDKVHASDPVHSADALAFLPGVIEQLLTTTSTAIKQSVTGNELTNVLGSFRLRTQSQEGMQSLLQAAFNDSSRYYEQYVRKDNKAKKEK